MTEISSTIYTFWQLSNKMIYWDKNPTNHTHEFVYMLENLKSVSSGTEFLMPGAKFLIYYFISEVSNCQHSCIISSYCCHLVW